MSGVTFRSVQKRYGDLEIIHGIDLSMDEEEFCVFVGPSDCEKSTLLRIFAEVEETTTDQISQ